jgi:hypothetical protein
MPRAVVRLSSDVERRVFAVGAVAGVGVFLAGPRPTGTVAIDAILVIAAVTGCVWAAASAPWWSLIVLAGLSALLADPLWAKIAGGVVFAAALYVGAKMRSQPVPRAVLVGASLLVMATAGDVWKFGFSSLIGIGAAGTVAVLGLIRRPGRDRRIAARVGMVAGGVVVLGLAGLAIAAVSARDDLSAGNTAVREGMRLAKEGEFDAAQAQFEVAASHFRQADSAVTMPWAQVSRVVPIAAQHRTAADELAGSAADATRTLDVEMRQLDLDALRIVDSRIDIDAVTALREPMLQVQEAIDDLDQAMADSQNGWLIPPVADRLTDLTAEVDEQQVVAQRALDALDVAPAVLGADGERVYFVMFTTPAEARGQGGFMGNYAEITIDQGRIEMTEFGRHTDLNQTGDRPRKLENAPEDWLARYGPFGYQQGPDKIVGAVPWSNITMSPNFPSTAQVVAELYPQSGGQEIDGVISLDVYALEQLVGLVGPLEIEGAAEPLTVDNTAQFLLVDQYFEEDVGERVDMLESVARTTIERLLSVAPPPPLDLAKSMAPLVEQRRVLAWAPEEAEQAVLTATSMDGALLSGIGAGNLPETDGTMVTPQGVAVTAVNASGSKIDSFLERDYEYVSDPAGDELRLSLTNTAPSSGYPDYVIGNLVDLPAGWSRLFLTVHTTRPIESASLDGQPVDLSPGREAGTNAYSTYVDIGPGATADLEVRFAEADNGTATELVLQPQPLATAERWTVTVDGDASTPQDLATVRAIQLTESLT